MKKGEVIQGYTILQDFTTVGGGLSKWSFAAKGESEFFIKEFLSPTYPVDGAPGSATIKAQKRRQCEQFEAHHTSLMRALAGKSSVGGNLIITRDFFRAGPKYYKITDKIDVTSLKIQDIARFPLRRRVLILRTVAHSLRILHQLNIVHGDLKPANILIKETLTGDYTTKLIDFDDSYFAGKPPANSEEVVGDPVYYSPELGGYVQGHDSIPPDYLTTQSDIFALGLVYCQYLTGTLPDFDREAYTYPYVAVQNDSMLGLEKIDNPVLAALLAKMLQPDPATRPNIHSVFEQLKSDELWDFEAREGAAVKSTMDLRPREVSSPPVLPTAAPSGDERSLRGSLVSPSDTIPTADGESLEVAKPASRLKGSLLKGSPAPKSRS